MVNPKKSKRNSKQNSADSSDSFHIYFSFDFISKSVLYLSSDSYPAEAGGLNMNNSNERIFPG
jgi:hypothetical protein